MVVTAVVSLDIPVTDFTEVDTGVEQCWCESKVHTVVGSQSAGHKPVALLTNATGQLSLQ